MICLCLSGHSARQAGLCFITSFVRSWAVSKHEKCFSSECHLSSCLSVLDVWMAALRTRRSSIICTHVAWLPNQCCLCAFSMCVNLYFFLSNVCIRHEQV